jgi:hypothetical protein
MDIYLDNLIVNTKTRRHKVNILHIKKLRAFVFIIIQFIRITG